MRDAESEVSMRTVLAFCEAWSRLDMDAIVDLLAPGIDYHNVPLKTLSGKAEVERYLRNAGPFEACNWELRSIAVNGPKVLTERIDTMVVRGRVITLQVMGVFEIEKSTIRRWRDYFDLASYRAQWPIVEARA